MKTTVPYNGCRLWRIALCVIALFTLFPAISPATAQTGNLGQFDRRLLHYGIQVGYTQSKFDLRFSEDTFANAQLFFSNSRRLAQYVAPYLDGERLWPYTCQANDTYHTLTLYKEN